MKLFLIRLGKAWHVLRQEGFFRGGKRVLYTFSLLFRRIRPGDILFLSGGVGDSARYRTTHVAEELAAEGFRTACTVQDNPFLLSSADKFSVFVFHRVLVTEKVKRFIAALKSKKKTIIFETDDLVYDPAFLVHMDYYHVMNPLEKKLYEHGVGGDILSDPYVEVATTTTHFLAEKLRAKGKRVFVVPNKLSEEDLLWAQAIRVRKTENAKRQTAKTIRIGYLSGTPSHNKDFATIIEPLKSILTRYPMVELVLAGPLDTDHMFEAFQGRIRIEPFRPRKELFELIATLDINLAPLEIGNPFCEAKSELKFFEAGVFGVPTVAAATDTFRRAIIDGVDGFVAATPTEWEANLKRLIEDESLRRTMGERAQATALARFSTTAHASPEYYAFLRSKITR